MRFAMPRPRPLGPSCRGLAVGPVAPPAARPLAENNHGCT